MPTDEVVALLGALRSSSLYTGVTRQAQGIVDEVLGRLKERSTPNTSMTTPDTWWEGLSERCSSFVRAEQASASTGGESPLRGKTAWCQILESLKRRVLADETVTLKDFDVLQCYEWLGAPQQRDSINELLGAVLERRAGAPPSSVLVFSRR